MIQKKLAIKRAAREREVEAMHRTPKPVKISPAAITVLELPPFETVPPVTLVNIELLLADEPGEETWVNIPDEDRYIDISAFNRVQEEIEGGRADCDCGSGELEEWPDLVAALDNQKMHLIKTEVASLCLVAARAGYQRAEVCFCGTGERPGYTVLYVTATGQPLEDGAELMKWNREQRRKFAIE